jgi:hypothetical protein
LRSLNITACGQSRSETRVDSIEIPSGLAFVMVEAFETGIHKQKVVIQVLNVMSPFLDSLALQLEATLMSGFSLARGVNRG